MRDVLTLEETVRALRTKETEPNNFGVIKEESAHFAARGGFRGGQGGARRSRSVYDFSNRQ